MKIDDRILFRGKLENRICWAEGYLVKTRDNRREVYNIIDPKVARWYIIDRRTICQSTGLRDKNGKLIFENDIVKYHFSDKYAPIKYGLYQNCFDSQKTGHIGFYVDWPKNINMRKDLGYWISMVNAEVVGNIFDNPELLEMEE